jgi:hypothetical protein
MVTVLFVLVIKYLNRREDANPDVSDKIMHLSKFMEKICERLLITQIKGQCLMELEDSFPCA